MFRKFLPIRKKDTIFWLVKSNCEIEIVKFKSIHIMFSWRFLIQIYLLLFLGTSWCKGRIIGSPRQRSRVQDPISTINIHEGSHWISEPYTLWGSHALTNSTDFRQTLKYFELRVWINLNLDPSDKPNGIKRTLNEFFLIWCLFYF